VEVVRRRAVLFAALLALVALVCCGRWSPGPDSTPAAPGAQEVAPLWPGLAGAFSDQPGGAWWAATPASELVPTGIEVVTRALDRYDDTSTVMDLPRPGLVVDGAGAVWVSQPWRLTRVDPASGYARSWDVGDDLAFGRVRLLRRSGSGVWLVESRRVRLFDGERFVRDLVVPGELLGGAGHPIRDMVEVGDEVWIAGDAGVARFVGGGWSPVRTEQVVRASRLAVDQSGVVWAVGAIRSEGGSRPAVLRFDGAWWSAPGGQGAPPFVEQIVIDPDGGVLAVFGSVVSRFDGQAWHELYRAGLGSVGMGSVVRAVSAGPGSIAVLVGSESVVRCDALGTCATVALDSEREFQAIAASGRDVLLADDHEVALLRGDVLREIWRDAAGSDVSATLVCPVDADEIWAGPSAWSDGVVMRFRSGRWEPVDDVSLRSGWEQGTSCDGALAGASDGAIWVQRQEAVGVARFDGEIRTDIPWEPGGAARGISGLLPGPDGAVWVVPDGSVWVVPDDGLQGSGEDWEQLFRMWEAEAEQLDEWDHTLTLLRADGSSRAVSLPVGASAAEWFGAGADGSLWIVSREQRCVEDECVDQAPQLRRYDGQWHLVPFPGSDIRGLSITSNGSLWAELERDDSPRPSVLARYTDGSWAQFPVDQVLESVVAAPGRAPCGIDPAGPDLVCLGPGDDVAITPISQTDTLLMGADGSVWLGYGAALARVDTHPAM
jgi:hypothetical protein